MLRVLNCLAVEHDHRLVALAALVCVLTAGLAVRLLGRLERLNGLPRAAWVAIVALIAGMGVWATHFVAMVAYRPGVDTGYEPVTTILSMMAAVALIGGAVEAFVRWRSKTAAALAGGLFGAGVGVMHYAGMEAFRLEGYLIWNRHLVAASILLGIGFGAAALCLARASAKPWARAGAAALLTLSICGLHFTGMAAVVIIPDPAIHLPASLVPNEWLALWVAAGAMALFGVSAGALLFEARQRRAEKRRLSALADAAVEGLVICRDDLIIIANKSFATLIGREEDFTGRSFSEFFEEDISPKAISAGGSTVHLFSSEGERIPVELSVQPILYDGAVHIGVSVRDLRDRVAAEAHIRFLAHHDPLTRLPNRLSFSQKLEQELSRRRRQEDELAVLCLDLDRFKQVNDVFGHSAGDAVLKATGARINAVLKPSDVLARLGGDEFAILRTEGCDRAQLNALCEAIIAAVSPEILVEGHATIIGSSIGVALYPTDGTTATVLMRNADAALYQAKNDGRGVYRYFNEAIGAELRERERLEFDLRHALVRGELEMVYQPQTNLESGEVTGFEALIRWNSPSRGAVSPEVFIPIAEETGLILPIGEWILREACEAAAAWEKPLQIAVNVSGVQLKSPKLASFIHQVLVETGLPPQRLEIEITETALIQDFHAALNTLRRIKGLGVRVAMDDFGTGYSSLSNLRAFPFDKLKIDRSFIQNVDNNEQSATIVRAVIGLAKGLNVAVVAEGVESSEELDFLKSHMCVEAQGYYLGRPGKLDAFREAWATEAAPHLPAPGRVAKRRTAGA
jgi:diguanylate cyclase (GGDEF)-like protein